MAVVHVTRENFEQLLQDHAMIVLDFWAPWCGPCRTYGPIFEDVSDGHPDVLFGKINTDEQQELAGAFGIQSIPSTVFFRERVALHLQPGVMPRPGLEDMIRQMREIDMEQVRAEMATQA
ncbi:MAG TPA: thioredoxin family protein [Myxococcota bacterium]|nr:thioredoxin family protein [Myxococcota bacterium]